MLNIYDDVFDKQWLDEVSAILSKEPWYADNVANRKTWPYGNKGTHLLLGNTYFQRFSEDKINYNNNKNFTNSLIDAFNQIKKVYIEDSGSSSSQAYQEGTNTLDILGDGTGGKVSVTVNANGKITDATVSNGGKNYTYGIVNLKPIQATSTINEVDSKI